MREHSKVLLHTRLRHIELPNSIGVSKVKGKTNENNMDAANKRLLLFYYNKSKTNYLHSLKPQEYNIKISCHKL